MSNDHKATPLHGPHGTLLDDSVARSLDDRDYEREVGARLKELRLSRDMTLQKAGERIGVTRMQISHWESGRKMPTIRSLRKLALLYATTSDHIIGI